MPSKRNSAGILIYKVEGGQLLVFLVHPGGPFWKRKDLGAWSIPKGELDDTEDPLEAAIRELQEETGLSVSGNFIELGSIRQKSGKRVFAWAVEGNVDPATIKSNSFEMEWPPRSGKKSSFPEVDKAAWFSVSEAREKIIPAQIPLLEEFERLVAGNT